MKVLNVIETAYRATVEEQDDTSIWLTHVMKGAGADLTVLLRSNAVNYAVKAQNAAGLSFGAKKQTNPPDIAGDLVKLMGTGVKVYAVQDDLAERGLERNELVDGIEYVPRSGIAKLVASFDQVWHW
jgi:intracellular sulfur oxidation DsrE/DsrF family protein